ncbi:MAG: DUF2442 domain-containing protein [Oscillospiraceae bacterium]|jgi:hypothetical protein|nr:DUF2442 domain-containing protein [Oscillospiraceae bacterium]
MYEQNGYCYGGTPEQPATNVLGVVGVKALPDYRLWLKFTDGAQRIYDFTADLDSPVFRPLREKSIFESVYLEYGATVWQDGAIDIAPETLYYAGYEA